MGSKEGKARLPWCTVAEITYLDGTLRMFQHTHCSTAWISSNLQPLVLRKVISLQVLKALCVIRSARFTDLRLLHSPFADLPETGY